MLSIFADEINYNKIMSQMDYSMIPLMVLVILAAVTAIYVAINDRRNAKS